MFNSNNWQIKLVYAGLGGFLMLIGMLLSPVTAQRDTFGEIECTALKIVDANGIVSVAVGEGQNGGFVRLFDKEKNTVTKLNYDKYGEVQCRSVGVVDGSGKGMVALWGVFSGGRVDVFNNDGLSQATLRVTKHGGHIIANGKNGNASADLRVTEHGGRLDVFGKDRLAKATIHASEEGGLVNIWDNADGVSKAELREAELIFGKPFKDGKSQVGLSVTENGGRIHVD